MKYQILLFISILCYNYTFSKNFTAESFVNNINQNDTAIYPLDKLISIDFNKYLNKPIDTFLVKIPTGYVLSKLFSSDNLKCRNRIAVYYGNNITYCITVDQFQYMNPCNLNRIWDINLFRKEKIGSIELYNENGDCVKGCP